MRGELDRAYDTNNVQYQGHCAQQITQKARELGALLRFKEIMEDKTNATNK